MKSRFLGALLFLLLPATRVAATEAEFDAAAVFNSRCAACHTVGRGEDVGPDLQGVTERRDRAWLVPFIQSSQSMIGNGDPTATELFERFRRQKMPDHPYSPGQIDEILAYIGDGGPSSTPRIRPAASASPEEIVRGRDLFFGRSGQEASCASCHTVGVPGRSDAFYLGGSLTHGFSKYQDVELVRRLARKRKVCRRVLEAEESFLVRAYLRHVDAQGGESEDAVGFFPLLGLAGAALLVVASHLAGGARRVTRKLYLEPGGVP